MVTSYKFNDFKLNFSFTDVAKYIPNLYMIVDCRYYDWKYIVYNTYT